MRNQNSIENIKDTLIYQALQFEFNIEALDTFVLKRLNLTRVAECCQIKGYTLFNGLV